MKNQGLQLAKKTAFQFKSKFNANENVAASATINTATIPTISRTCLVAPVRNK